MTKRVATETLEHALRRALLILGESRAEAAMIAATGSKRSASLLRKCADPDNDRYQIQLRYAVALDAACVRCGHPPPLLGYYKRRLAETTAPPPETHEACTARLSRSVVGLQAILGQLADALRPVLSEGRSEGPTREERVAMFDTIELLIAEASVVAALICRYAATESDTANGTQDVAMRPGS